MVIQHTDSLNEVLNVWAIVAKAYLPLAPTENIT